MGMDMMGVGAWPGTVATVLSKGEGAVQGLCVGGLWAAGPWEKEVAVGASEDASGLPPGGRAAR